MKTIDLVEDLSRLPAQPAAALRVLQMVEDPRSSSADLAHLIETDPALSARVMRLANAPYYGLSRKVGSASRAVVLLGFSTVRALAVSAACGLLAGDANLGPAGFWSYAVTVATGASVVAGHIGANPGEAFSAGLLHDIGVVLLFRRDPVRYQSLVEAAGTDYAALVIGEHDAFGATHAEAGAAALEAWRFPPAFVRAVADHHNPPERVGNTLGRLVIAGQGLAAILDAPPAFGPPTEAGPALEAVGLAPESARSLAVETRRELQTLAKALGMKP